MIYSRSAEYAIRAFMQLAGVTAGKYISVKQIAEQSGLPRQFLVKILQPLVRKGLLRSRKGPTGGFALRKAAAEITMIELVESIDGLRDYQRCLAGLSECNDNQPCGLHDGWKALRDRIIEYLRRTTIAELGEARNRRVRPSGRMRRARRSAAKK